MNDLIRNKKPTRKYKWLFWVAGIVGLLALIYYFSAGFFEPEQPKIMTFIARKGNIEETVLATGTLKPIRLVAVGAQASGRITALNVEVGQQVKQNDLIAQIDATTQQNDLRKAQASLTSNQAQREEKIANLALAKQTLERQKLMIASHAVSKADYDTAITAVKTAEAQIAVSDAQIIEAQISVETAKANLGYTQISAPIDGTILAIVAQQGQTVNAAQSAPTIAIIGQLDHMSVEADISEADIINVHTGQDVYFTIPGQNKTQYTAKLERVDPAPQSITSDSSFSSTGSSSSNSSTASAVYYKGIFQVPNPDGILRTYMTAEIHIILGSATDVIIVPSAAVVGPDADGKSFVRIMDDNGKITDRTVETGLNDKVMIEIVSGLHEGEKVVNGSLPQGAASPPNSSRRGRTIRF